MSPTTTAPYATGAGRAGDERVRAWLTSLVDSVPAPAKDGTVPLQAVVSAVLDFLEQRTARSNALDHRAAAALAGIHRRASRAWRRSPVRCPRRCGSSGNASSRSRSRPSVRAPAISTRRSLSQAGYAGRAHLFIVGLEEGRVFSPSTEDAVLLDEERARDLGGPAAVDRPHRRGGVWRC